uniref:glutathione transferase n=1 Tax=Mus spicilegus TaxID=10103 RepID=A0A8C6HKX8_MUSSI
PSFLLEVEEWIPLLLKLDHIPHQDLPKLCRPLSSKHSLFLKPSGIKAHCVRLQILVLGGWIPEIGVLDTGLISLYAISSITAPDYDRSQWLSEKFKLGLDFPNLPYLIDGSHKITQSNAILRYLARKHHLGEWGWPQGGGWGIISSAWQGWDAECTVCAAGGETEEERIRADIVENQVMDTRMQLIMLCYNPDFEKQKPEFLKTVPEKMKLYSEFLGKRPWFAGDKVKGRVGRRSCHPPLVSDSRALNLGFLQVTYVDFLAYDILDQYRMFEPKCLDAFPNLRDFLARFEGLKKISAYMKSSRYIATPVFSKMAHWSNK